jgi:hypothetical protein
MTFPSPAEIIPRLRALFSSRFVVVETGQSPGIGPAMDLSGAVGAGYEGGASDVLLLDELGGTLAAAPLVVAPAAGVRFFFFTIRRSEEDLKSGGGAAVVSKKDGRRKKNARRKQGKGENCPLKVTN